MCPSLSPPSQLRNPDAQNTEISILRSPSIGYSFPTIPLYYLFELEVHVEYIRAMRVERGELWDKILQRTLMGLERATTGILRTRWR